MSRGGALFVDQGVLGEAIANRDDVSVKSMDRYANGQ